MRLHISHRLVQIHKPVLVAVDDAARLQLPDEVICHGAPEDLHIPSCTVFDQLQHRLGPRGVHAVEHLAVEDHELEAPVRGHVTRLLGLEAVADVAGDGVRRGEEDVALQPDHHEPAVGDVLEVLLNDHALGALASGDVLSCQGASGDRGDAGVLHDEGDAAEDYADPHRGKQLAKDDEYREDEEDLDPLREAEVLPGTPEILRHEAGSSEEEHGPQEEPRQVVEVRDGSEQGRATQPCIQQSRTSVEYVAHDPVVDHVELELHVSHGRTAGHYQGVTCTMKHDLVVLGDLNRHLVLGCRDLQNAVQNTDNEHQTQVWKCCNPRTYVDLVRLSQAVSPNGIEGCIVHLWEHEIVASRLVDVGASSIEEGIEDAQRYQQANRHDESRVANMHGLQEIHWHANACRRNEEFYVVVAELERILEDFVAYA
mmetsp:Transcript_117903/g.345436  ORF Transcript_117903/g.345436 Transcript_117903/m.345436 type:complete len:427 (+) Transcript_117903:1775-3055(+)